MRMHIFGASGSGVTTLGHALSRQLGSLYVDTDDYHWLPTQPPFTHKRDPQERTSLLLHDLGQHSDWILGGTVYNWGEVWRSAFDFAVYLWVPAAQRLARLQQREDQCCWLYGEQAREYRQRADEFIRWSAHYDSGDLTGRSRHQHEAWIEQLTCPVLRIEGNQSVAERVDAVNRAIHSIPQKIPGTVGHRGLL